MLALAEILREEATVLDALVDEALSGRGRIELARLRELGPALARLVVQRLRRRRRRRTGAGASRAAPTRLPR